MRKWKKNRDEIQKCFICEKNKNIVMMICTNNTNQVHCCEWPDSSGLIAAARSSRCARSGGAGVRSKHEVKDELPACGFRRWRNVAWIAASFHSCLPPVGFKWLHASFTYASCVQIGVRLGCQLMRLQGERIQAGACVWKERKNRIKSREDCE